MHCTEGPSRPAFWAKGLVTSRVSLRCQKKTTLKRQITNFFYDKNSFTAISQIFCKLPYHQNIYNHETALKNSATSKDQQFLLQCISFCSFFLLSCWEGVITNCSEIQQSLAFGFIRLFVKYDFGLGLNFAEFLLYILVRSIEI